MKRIFILAAFVAAALPAQEFKLGGKIAEFTVQDPSGNLAAFSALRGPITVVTFTSVQCPVSNAYNDRMSSVYRDYTPKGVKFIFVNANRTEPAKEVAAHAKDVGFPFPVYKDVNNKLADRFDAQVTPESYVIDRSGTIVYHGQIDDNRNEPRVDRKPLCLALDALLEGKPVPIAETKAFGCTIKRLRKS